MIYISIDCGIKSLAIVIIKNNIFDIELLYANINKLTEKNINNMNINDLVIISKCLKKSLCEIDKYVELIKSDKEEKIMILIEYQMNINNKTNYICSQLIYHFTNDNNNIMIINPSLKNSISFTNELCYGNFISKYRTNYTANKNHTKKNFIYWINKNNKNDILKNIEKKNYDDVADAFMMCIGYINNTYDKDEKKNKFIKNICKN